MPIKVTRIFGLENNNHSKSSKDTGFNHHKAMVKEPMPLMDDSMKNFSFEDILKGIPDDNSFNSHVEKSKNK